MWGNQDSNLAGPSFQLNSKPVDKLQAFVIVTTLNFLFYLST